MCRIAPGFTTSRAGCLPCMGDGAIFSSRLGSRERGRLVSSGIGPGGRANSLPSSVYGGAAEAKRVHVRPSASGCYGSEARGRRHRMHCDAAWCRKARRQGRHTVAPWPRRREHHLCLCKLSISGGSTGIGGSSGSGARFALCAGSSADSSTSSSASASASADTSDSGAPTANHSRRHSSYCERDAAGHRRTISGLPALRHFADAAHAHASADARTCSADRCYSAVCNGCAIIGRRFGCRSSYQDVRTLDDVPDAGRHL